MIPNTPGIQSVRQIVISRAIQIESSSAQATAARMSGRIYFVLYSVRRLAENVSTDTDPSLQPFEVTLSITGGLTVYGSSEDDAIRRANAMPSDDLIRNGCWDSPGATDAYEG